MNKTRENIPDNISSSMRIVVTGTIILCYYVQYLTSCVLLLCLCHLQPTNATNTTNTTNAINATIATKHNRDATQHTYNRAAGTCSR